MVAAEGLQGSVGGPLAPGEDYAKCLQEVPQPDCEEVWPGRSTPSDGASANDEAPGLGLLPEEEEEEGDGCECQRRPSLPTALREALHALADGSGQIAAERLQAMPGFDENVASALECRIGPGPWHLSRLEELLEVLLANGADTLGEEALGGSTIRVEVLHVTTPRMKRRRSLTSGDWRDFGLQQLEDALESALAADADTPECVHPLDADADAPENVHPLEAEDVEASLGQLQGSIVDRVVAPLLESGSGGGLHEEPALKELPAVVDELVGLVRRTWRLAHARGLQTTELRRGLAAARAEARAQAERAARAEADRAAGEADAHEQLDTSVAKLEALRETLRKRQAEAAEARHRAEQLERSGAQQAERIRQLEARARSEAERRAEEVEHGSTASGAGTSGLGKEEPSEDANAALAAEVALQRQQGQELRQRLASVEAELGQAREELSCAELQRCELRRLSERRMEALEAQLAESQQMAKATEKRLKEKLKAAQAAAASGSSSTPNLASACAMRGGAVTSRELRRARGSVPQPSSAGTLGEELQAQQRGRRHTVHADAPNSHRDGRKESQAIKEKSLKAPPADLRSLSKLLAGGILRG